MSKKDFSIVEVVTNGFDDLKEIAIINVDANTSSITGLSYMKIANENNDYTGYTLKEAMTTLIKMLDGKKVASHTGLDFESLFLNKLLKETHGFDTPIKRINVLDTHVLSMKYLKGIPKDMNSVAKHFNVATATHDNALGKAYTTYGIIKGLFSNKAIRQHTYIHAPDAVVFPEVKPTVIVEKVTTVVETTYTVV